MLDMLQTRLSDLAAWHGVIPVPNEVLEKHKRAEVRKHRGSWWYYHPSLANFFLRGGLLASSASTCIFAYLSFYCLLSERFATARIAAVLSVLSFYVCWKIVRSGAMSIHGLKVRGPAEWFESEDALALAAPLPIREIARHLMRENTTNDMRLICGRLIQDHVTIDPYLVIRRGNDQIVLGIWDDKRIIHQATTIA